MTLFYKKAASIVILQENGEHTVILQENGEHSYFTRKRRAYIVILQENGEHSLVILPENDAQTGFFNKKTVFLARN